MGEYAEERGRRADAVRIARVTHAANRVLTALFKDVPLQPIWKDTPKGMQEGNVDTIVEMMLDNSLTPEDLHDLWCNSMSAKGWTWGEVRDSEKKTHPGLKSWSECSEPTRIKGEMFHAVVYAMLGDGQ